MSSDHPHDKGYKLLLSKKTIFLELLENFVEADWVHQIDSKSITRLDKSYILPDFTEKEADLVYEAKINGQDILFYILLELQSTVDFQMPYRLMCYMNCIWQELIKNTDSTVSARKNFKLPAIVPLVLYNGNSEWTANRSFKESLTAADYLGDCLVDFRYILIKINNYTKEKLLTSRNLIGIVFFIDQAKNSREVESRLKETVSIIERFAQPNFRLLLIWLKRVIIRGLPPQARKEILFTLKKRKPEEAREMVSNISRVIRQKYEESLSEGIEVGMIKGKLEGKLEVAQKMLAKGFPMEMILEITGLSLEQIIS